MRAVTEKKILHMLKEIEKGKLKIDWINKDSTDFCGDAEYKISNGYTLVVFNDCYSFDYVDSFKDPDGNLIWEFSDNPDGELANYRPPEDKIYGLSGEEV